MKIAIPLVNGLLSLHFGHCQSFKIITIDTEKKCILSSEDLAAPAHEPGVLPRWLGEHNVELIITGGMGEQAKMLFTEQNIDVIVGAPVASPEEIVGDYMKGTLSVADNTCSH